MNAPRSPEPALDHVDSTTMMTTDTHDPHTIRHPNLSPLAQFHRRRLGLRKGYLFLVPPTRREFPEEWLPNMAPPMGGGWILMKQFLRQ